MSSLSWRAVAERTVAATAAAQSADAYRSAATTVLRAVACKFKSQPFSFLRVPQLRVPQLKRHFFKFRRTECRHVSACHACVRPRAHAAGGEGLPAAGTAGRVVQQQPADCMLSCQLSAAVSLRAAEPARFFNRPESLAELPRPKRLEVSKLLTLVIAKVPAAR
jgi:hypothetical protein